MSIHKLELWMDATYLVFGEMNRQYPAFKTCPPRLDRKYNKDILAIGVPRQ